MKIAERPFGFADGGECTLYTLTNAGGASFSVTDYGASLVSLLVPDKNGELTDVVLGFDSAEEYESGTNYFGAVIGRYANRISNAGFTLNGEKYTLAVNNSGGHTLHGGIKNYAFKRWNAELKDNGILFSLLSPDGDEGFPGNLTVTAEYTWTDDNILTLTYTGISDADTVCNITNHSYFNLAGHTGESAAKQLLMLNADYYTPADENLIPTGEVLSVANTPFDFRIPKQIEKDIGEDNIQLHNGGGYDMNFVLNKTERGKLESFGTLMSITSGIRMDVATTQPACQIYSDNGDTPRKGKGGAVYGKHAGIAVETQHFPDSIAKTFFPTPILKAGEKYEEVTIFAFGLL